MQPAPPPGFRIVSGAPAASPLGGRPILRRGASPQARVVQDGQIIDPNTGTARPISGFQPRATGDNRPQAIPGRPGWFMGPDGRAFQPKGLPPGPKDVADKTTFRDPIDKIVGVIDAAATAHRLTRKGGPAGSSIGRFLTGSIPGTTSKDINGYLDTIGGNTAFETLQQMRQDSPTGGAVGNVSDADMRLLRSTIASLDPAQGTEKFQADLAKVLKSYQKVLYQLPGGREAYHNWRVQWLGYDPAKKGQSKAPPKQGAVVDFNDLPE